MIFKDDYDIRTHDKWELNITGDCTFRCKNCICQCTQFPDKGETPFEAIEKFIAFISTLPQVVSVHISGGEPVLHSRFHDILRIVTDCANVGAIELYSNGSCKSKYEEVFKDIPNIKKMNFCYDNTKDSKESNFFPANIAPIDLGLYDENNYGCNNPFRSGISLYIDGKYYLCCVAGSIDRVFDLNLGIDNPEDITPARLNAQCKEYAKYCSMSMVPYRRTAIGPANVSKRTTEQSYSPSWKKKKDEFDKENE